MPRNEPPGPRRDWILERAWHCSGRALQGDPVIFDDTTEFMAIDRDHLVELEDDLYLINGHERERRFTLDGEPKYWVKRAVSLRDGSLKLLKMVFQERFKARVGPYVFTCVRSAEKEAQVLELVRGDGRFMQGRSTRDARGNVVRIINVIKGEDLLSHLQAMDVTHEEYFGAIFPEVLAGTIESLRALQRLHEAGLCHETSGTTTSSWNREQASTNGLILTWISRTHSLTS
jgi:hypothetical protein